MNVSRLLLSFFLLICVTINSYAMNFSPQQKDLIKKLSMIYIGSGVSLSVLGNVLHRLSVRYKEHARIKKILASTAHLLSTAGSYVITPIPSLLGTALLPIGLSFCAGVVSTTMFIGFTLSSLAEAVTGKEHNPDFTGFFKEILIDAAQMIFVTVAPAAIGFGVPLLIQKIYQPTPIIPQPQL